MHGTTILANPLKLDVRSHWKCLAICFIATVSTFQYGSSEFQMSIILADIVASLDYALVGGFLSMPGFLEVYGYYDPKLEKWNIDTTVQQLISSLITIGTFVSSLLVGPFSSYFGRKTGLWTASVLNFVATAIMLGTTDIGALYFACLLLGMSVDWFLTFSQLYVHEVAPAHLRGITFAVYQSQLSIGSIVGASVDYGTYSIDGRRAYQIPLAIFFAAPTIQSISLFFFPETPRWLMVQGKETSAEKSLRQLRNPDIDELQFQAELNEIRGSTNAQVQQSRKALFLEMWRGTNLRRTLLCICFVCFHAANGSSWVNIYTTYCLEIAGATQPFAFSVMMTCMGPLGVISSVFFVRILDRRTIMLAGVSACAFALLAPAIAWSMAPGSEAAAKVVVTFIALFTFCYVAYAPYAWLLGGEYPNNPLRGYSFGLATALNFLGNWLGTFTASYFINPRSLAWGPKYGYIWSGSNMVLAFFTYVFLPETKDRTLEEVHEMFEANIPARKFKGYVCHGVEELAAAVAGKGIVQHDEKSGAIHVEAASNHPEADAQVNSA